MKTPATALVVLLKAVFVVDANFVTTPSDCVALVVAAGLEKGFMDARVNPDPVEHPVDASVAEAMIDASKACRALVVGFTVYFSQHQAVWKYRLG